MCFYAEAQYKQHYACVSCRISFKQAAHSAARVRRCPNCAGPLVCAGHDFAPPPRCDVRAWSVVAAVLGEGLRYEGREACGCGKEPKYRPRTRAALRARRAVAARQGLPLAEVLSRPDPSTPMP
ncbi:hypothetical protein [Streptomyces sp. NBC_00566]|uniref:hypothetical protein n=1 Tax=Streptomyces sp. NBC_00566 TaxID=2975778 RepID=UPI002E80977E|nr:hypothetical protein [Streptomyces sp. NBC_00566]WUB88959.1 hypothetical protein OG812_21245 [Streptomyces sp. NBC_00566]